MIKVENMSFGYKDMTGNLFDHLNLEIEEGRIYGLLGKNGVGKSTLLYLLAGLIFPQEGTVNADGREVRKRQPETLGDMFILPDEFELPAVSIETFLEILSSAERSSMSASGRSKLKTTWHLKVSLWARKRRY